MVSYDRCGAVSTDLQAERACHSRRRARAADNSGAGSSNMRTRRTCGGRLGTPRRCRAGGGLLSIIDMSLLDMSIALKVDRPWREAYSSP